MAPTANRRPNILLLMTDQQRTVFERDSFPPGWKERFLPNLAELERTGVRFPNHITNTTPCTPARGVIMSGKYPFETGVNRNGTTLPPGLATLGTAMGLAGYDVAYKGKWHLDDSFNLNASFRPIDPVQVEHQNRTMLTNYGFPGWTSPDFGTADTFRKATSAPPPNNASFLNTLGGGTVNNDCRVVGVSPRGPCRSVASKAVQTVLDFLDTRGPADETPFFLVVSLVNPHDIFVFPNSYLAAGYPANFESLLQCQDVHVPASFEEDRLHEKPQTQFNYLKMLNGWIKPPPWMGVDFDATTDPAAREGYVKFYAYLMNLADQMCAEVHAKLVSQGLHDNTLVVRTSDHGEMGLAHGGLRQKMFTMYREALSVPLVFSNPQYFPTPQQSPAMVSHIDLAPTLASIAGLLPESIEMFAWGGTDYSALLGLGNGSAPPLPESALFTYTPDGQTSIPSNIVGLVTERYKYGVYYALDDCGNAVDPQYEMYDLVDDEKEITNLLYRQPTLPDAEVAELMHRKLTKKLGSSAPKGWGNIPPWQAWAPDDPQA